MTAILVNGYESSHQTVAFIQEKIKAQGLRIQCISPKSSIIYKANKKYSLKHYIQKVKHEKKYDFLIVYVSKNILKKTKDHSFNIDVTIIVDEVYEKNKTKQKLAQVTAKKLCSNKNDCYYVLPEQYQCTSLKAVTYGWSNQAHLSASSVQTHSDGGLKIQCCIGKEVCTLDGTHLPLKEFGISSSLTSIQSILAGVATLLLYGVDLETSNKKQIC